MHITDTTAFLKELECASCAKVVFAPIHMCTTGHLTCNSCYLSLSQFCNICDEMFSPDGRRVRVLENLMNLMEVKCINTGCASMLKPEHRSSHIMECNFR